MKKRGRRPDVARREMVARLRESGLSFAEIGASLHPQVSRQTAHVLYDRYLREKTFDKGKDQA